MEFIKRNSFNILINGNAALKYKFPCGESNKIDICKYLQKKKILGGGEKESIFNKKNYKYIILILLLILILAYYIYYVQNYKNRGLKCLSVYNNNNYNVNMKSILYKNNKLCDFFISSSYKSCLPCGTQKDIISYDALKLVLLKGARFIHLDIHYNIDGDINTELDKSEYTNVYPVVANMFNNDRSGLNSESKYINRILKINSTDELKLSKCLDIIKNIAWISNIDYPLFLYLEIYSDDNITVEAKIADIILNNISSKLLDNRYSFCRKNIGQEKISEYYNKIVIITNKFPYTSGKLNELINSKIENKGSFKNYIYTKENDTYHSDINKIEDNIDKDHLLNIIKDTAILYNKEYLSRSYREEEYYLLKSIHEPKYQVNNANPYKLWNYGFQFVCMNFQLYDDNMKEYINFFKQRSFILKPKHLRLILNDYKPPKQNKDLSFKPQTYMYEDWIGPFKV